MARRRSVSLVAGSAVLVAAALFAPPSLVKLLVHGPNEHAELQGALVTAASRAGDSGTVSLSDVYPADWDQVWIWDGYTADREHRVFPEIDFGPGGYGQDYVVAFGLSGKLVAWVRFNINEPIVYFDPPGEGFNLTRANARLRVIRDPNYPAGPCLCSVDHRNAAVLPRTEGPGRRIGRARRDVLRLRGGANAGPRAA
jgi:hypothetical protein